MKVRILKEDKRFSLYIRKRDKWTCNRCKRKHEEGSRGMENSHYVTRGAWNTRFDEENCDALCTACHFLWSGREREKYKEFKIKQLGEPSFNALLLRSNEPGNKRKLKEWAYEYYKNKL